LLRRGINRIGNVLVPDDRYVKFEEFLKPILEEVYLEQKKTGRIVTPSELVWKMGERINDENSICYWAWKNRIKIFCPTIMDGSIGDIAYVFSGRKEDTENKSDPSFVSVPQSPGKIQGLRGLKIDILRDTKELNDSTAGLEKSGVVLLGSGVVKHSILNANLFRNGADYAVYINTAQEYDGSDAGAEPDEAVTWKKIKIDGEMIKVFGDATILFPLLVAESFAKV